MTEYSKRLARTQDNWRTRIQAHSSDGLATILLKAVLRYPAFFALNRIFVPTMRLLERPSQAIVRRLRAHGQHAVHQWWIAIDIYKAMMTVLLLVGYGVTTELVRRDATSPIHGGVIVVVSLFATVRCIELFTLMMLLFNDPAYSPRSSFRTVANSFWHYFEFVLIFAILYAADCGFDRGAICNSKNQSLAESRQGPFYFSAVTMATIGYGDYVPNSSEARILVCVQVFLGLFLVLMVLPSCISSFGHRVEVKAKSTPRRPELFLPWLSRVAADAQGVVRLGGDGAQIGCVLLIRSRDFRRVLLVQKQFATGYEHSSMWSMPGGTVRVSEEVAEIGELVRDTLVRRVEKETGLTISAIDVLQVPLVPPPVSAAMRFEEQRITIVIPFLLLGSLDDNVQVASTASSIAQCRWLERPFEWRTIAPANRIILAFYLWQHLSEEERSDARWPVEEAFRDCNGWASQAGFPLAHPWFSETP